MGNFLGYQSMYGLVFTNNLAVSGNGPFENAFPKFVSCARGDVPITVLKNCFSTYTFEANGMIASPAPPSSWPKENFFPSDTGVVQFVDYKNGNGGNYALQPSSPYVNKGTDGKDLGADIVGLNAALAGVE